jgi:hypothetical protein
LSNCQIVQCQISMHNLPFSVLNCLRVGQKSRHCLIMRLILVISSSNHAYNLPLLENHDNRVVISNFLFPFCRCCFILPRRTKWFSSALAFSFYSFCPSSGSGIIILTTITLVRPVHELFASAPGALHRISGWDESFQLSFANGDTDLIITLPVIQ